MDDYPAVERDDCLTAAKQRSRGRLMSRMRRVKGHKLQIGGNRRGGFRRYGRRPDSGIAHALEGDEIVVYWNSPPGPRRQTDLGAAAARSGARRSPSVVRETARRRGWCHALRRNRSTRDEVGHRAGQFPPSAVTCSSIDTARVRERSRNFSSSACDASDPSFVVNSTNEAWSSKTNSVMTSEVIAASFRLARRRGTG